MPINQSEIITISVNNKQHIQVTQQPVSRRLTCYLPDQSAFRQRINQHHMNYNTGR